MDKFLFGSKKLLVLYLEFKKRKFSFSAKKKIIWNPFYRAIGEGACSVGVINVSAMAHEVSINHRQYFYSVELPPQKMDTENPKVLELEQGLDKPQLNIEVSHSSQISLRRLGGHGHFLVYINLLEKKSNE